MSKKLLSHSLKLLKLSTWIGGILAIFVVLLVAVIMAFPALIKAPLETQLSELSHLDIQLSEPYLNFNNGELFLQIDKLEAINTQQKNLMMKVEHLKWQLQLSSLLKDIYNPSRIFIDTLTFNLSAVEKKSAFGVRQVQRLVALLNSKAFDSFKMLKINKTLIKGEQDIEIAPLSITSDNKQFLLKVTGQSLNVLDTIDTNASKVNISVTIPSVPTKNAMLNLPIVISNIDFSTTVNIKFINQAGDNIVELDSFLKQIPANRVANYLSPQLVGKGVYSWIKNGFLVGTLQDSKLQIRKNLSKPDATQVQFSSQLKDMELAFNADWEPLKKLNAGFQTDGRKMTLTVHHAKLNDTPLNNINVQIDDITQQDLDVEVTGKVSTQSQHLVKFLKRAPLDKSVHQILNSFNLSGKAQGDIALVFPLDERNPILDIDVRLKDNHLAVLDGKVVVKNYDSKVAFHNNEISAIGVGNIRGKPFKILINPNHRVDNKARFSVELAAKNSDLEVYMTQQLDQSWRAEIDSEALTGNMAIFPNDEGILDVRLLDVKVTTLDAIKGDWKLMPQDLPDMHLSTNNIRVDEDVLPNFSVKLLAKDNRLLIQDLQFERLNISNKAIKFHGDWVDGKTRFYVKATGENLAEFLQKLKIKEKVTGGAFDFDVQLACECDPWNMNYQNISGYFDMQVDKGVFTNKDPNIGRILSLLNIKSIAKRLNLNFSDITNKGFTYKTMKIRLHLQNAIAKIENFDLESSSSSITLTGQSHVVDQQYDLMAKITPAVNNAVPIATYLAGGGLIGLGVWAIDETLFSGKLINKAVDKIVTFEYKITGPWDKPIIKEQ